MRNLAALCICILVSGLLAVVSVHYLEEGALPFVDVARRLVYGDLPHDSAEVGCHGLRKGEWVHPTALALTVYGEAQSVLKMRFGGHGPEVLPSYATLHPGMDELFCVADFFIGEGGQRKIGQYRVMLFPFQSDYEKYELEDRWLSGLTQGMVGQVLLAAYIASSKPKYLDAARQAGNILAIPINEGGVKVTLDGGGTWFAEYAQRGTSPPLVLNGHLLALDFLYWMNKIEPGWVWKDLFSSGVHAVVLQVSNYEGPFWSYYDQRNTLATRKYQAFHVRQLQRYSMHDESGALQRAAEQMQLQLYIPLGVFQRLLTQPTRLLFFLTASFSIVYFPAVWVVIRVRSRLAGGEVAICE